MTYLWKLVLIPAALALSLLLSLACGGDGEEEPEAGVGITAVAVIMDAAGETLGTVTLTQGPQGVLVSAELRGLPPGGHGFHIHETGACAPDFSAAGSHFNPTDQTHGFLFSTGQHAGDLPNLYVAADGTVRADVFTNDISLAGDDDRSLFDDDGSAVIIHEKADAYGEDSGTAGGRIACGVIERS